MTDTVVPQDLPPEDIAGLVAEFKAANIDYPLDLESPSHPVEGASHQSRHLVMRDGVRVAIDIHVPPLVNGQHVPTCIRSTRYWRSPIGSRPHEYLRSLEIERWLRHGFALVLMDVRGTGASFGTWDRGWDDNQRDDLSELVDWVIAQPWSDGNVTGYGTSYDGSTAQLLACTGHPAVRAVVPRFALFDSFVHISAPGGVPLDGFLENWASLNWILDGQPQFATKPPAVARPGDVRPVDDDHDGALLRAARDDHKGNWDLWGSFTDAFTREDSGPGVNAGQGTPYARLADLRAARVPIWLWSSWYDGAYADAQLLQLEDPELDVRVTIGPYAHGAGFPSLGDPLLPHLRNQSGEHQIGEMAAFMRSRLDGVTPDPSPSRLRYYRLGDGWHDSEVWPPTGTQSVRHFLHASGELSPTAGAGHRSYDVDFAATTGTSGTRWHTLIGGAPVTYPDRREQDERLLTWESGPSAAPVDITGTPFAHLDIISDASDFAAHLYLEAVLADGTVLYLTEGELLASQRKPGTGPAPYGKADRLWHSHTAADVEPVVPGAVTALDFQLWPISALLPKGSRVRVALAGADAGNFRRIPRHGSVQLDVLASSWVDIPSATG